MKTREEQLEAWKAKRSKPLAAIGSNNVVNRPPKAPAKRLAVLNAVSRSDQTAGAASTDKENQLDQPIIKASTANKTNSISRLPRFKQTAGSDKASTSKPNSLPAVKAETHVSRKAVLPAAALENMENQYDLLKGTLDTLKRESVRCVTLHECT